MQTDLQHKTNGVTQTEQSIREGILEFEDMLGTCDGVIKGDSEVCPLKHSFCDGIYVREIRIPAGMTLTGKIHLHSHPNFLMQGEVEVYTEYGGIEYLQAPLAMISKAGTKRIVRTISECVWITVHHNPTNTQDLNELEKIVIADSYDEYEKFIAGTKPFYNRILASVKRFLTVKKRRLQ